ncbi:hypothetical protein Leryth_016507 [Lithospermum erythrorhizon]|nr:hypothetical protein Leryth_016507 [Lithospermum erythrorhizon]
MGNGGSKQNHSSQVPQNIRPLLQQRFGEVKKKLQARGRINPYKRELLDKDNGEGSGSSAYKFIPARKSSAAMSSYDDDRLSCVTVEGSKDIYVKHARKESSSSTQDECGIGYVTAASSPSNFKEDDNGEDLGDRSNRMSVYVENDEEDDENDQSDGRLLIRRNDFDEFPSSPSFRVYCTEDDINRKSFDERFRLENGLVKEETPSEEEEESQVQENQKDEPKKAKQGRRKRSFRKVIPTGGRIKNLLHNVNSCSPRGQARAHCKLTEKENS